jgi:hypothetical protein
MHRFLILPIAYCLAFPLASCKPSEPSRSTGAALACEHDACPDSSSRPIPEAAVLMANTFAEALRDGAWDKALSVCSEQVKQACGKYETPEQYFKDVVPIQAVREGLEVRIQARKGHSLYGGAIAVRAPSTGRELQWPYWMEKVEGHWRIGFITTPLDEWIEQTIARQQRKAPGGLSWDAHAVMKNFRAALKREAWADALSFCSQDVNAAAGQYSSHEVFFKDIVPVDRIVKASRFPVCYSKTLSGDLVLYRSFVQLTEPNERPTVQWTWELRKISSGKWIMEFRTIPLDRWIEQETNRRRREMAEFEQRRKEAESRLSGVHTHLTAVTEEFVIGKPMLFKLTLINDGSNTIYYDDQQAAVNESMTITDARGRRQPYVAPMCQTCGEPESLAPGASAVIFERLDISKQYEIVKPGEYSVQFSGRGLWAGLKSPQETEPHRLRVKLPFPSNTLKINVKAR